MMKRNKSFTSNEPLLYLVATPIGNLKEFSPRAIEVISSADLVCAEDTRNTAKLLHHFNIDKPLLSLHEHNEKEKSLEVIKKIKTGEKVVYVSDAGYPGISDPSNILVKECLLNDINVSFVSGSSAFIGALISSGFNTENFYFEGFLPAKTANCEEKLQLLKVKKETLIFYEAPHRIHKTLESLHKILGNRNAVIARELTKINEEFIRGTLEELCKIDEVTIKGEIVIVVEGNKEEVNLDKEEIQKQIDLLLNKGLSKKDTIEILSSMLKINKNVIYDLVK